MWTTSALSWSFHIVSVFFVVVNNSSDLILTEMQAKPCTSLPPSPSPPFSHSYSPIQYVNRGSWFPSHPDCPNHGSGATFNLAYAAPDPNGHVSCPECFMHSTIVQSVSCQHLHACHNCAFCYEQHYPRHGGFSPPLCVRQSTPSPLRNRNSPATPTCLSPLPKSSPQPCSGCSSPYDQASRRQLTPPETRSYANGACAQGFSPNHGIFLQSGSELIHNSALSNVPGLCHPVPSSQKLQEPGGQCFIASSAPDIRINSNSTQVNSSCIIRNAYSGSLSRSERETMQVNHRNDVRHTGIPNNNDNSLAAAKKDPSVSISTRVYAVFRKWFSFWFPHSIGQNRLWIAPASPKKSIFTQERIAIWCWCNVCRRKFKSRYLSPCSLKWCNSQVYESAMGQ